MKKALLIMLILGLLPFNSFTADSDLLKLSGEKINIPDKFFTITGFKDFQSRPFPLPDAYTTQNGRTLYKAIDIWRHNQALGRWANNKIELTLAEMTMAPLKNLDSLVPETDVKNYNSGDKANLDSAGEWLEMFTESECEGDVKTYINPSGIKFSVYTVNTGSGNYIIAFVSNNYSVSGNPLVFLYSMKTKPDKYEKSLIYNSVKSIKVTHKTSSENIKKSDSPASTDETGTASSNTADFIRQSLKNMKDWNGAEYEGFIIVTNLPKGAKLLSQTQSELVLCRKLFNFFYPDTAAHKEKCIVRIFKNSDDYKAYVSEQYQNTGGIWMPSKKELALSSPVLSRTNSSNVLRQVLLHEAFHQFMHYAVEGAYTPPWFNEGNSCFFEGTVFGGSKTTISTVQRYMNITITGIKKNQFNLKKLISMDYDQFYQGNVMENYSFAWALIYFLQKGAPIVKKICGRDYSDILNTYYRELCKSGSDAVASEKAWGTVNMEQFTSDFCSFYNSKSAIQKAESYDIVEARKRQ